MTADGRLVPAELREQRRPACGAHGERDALPGEIVGGELVDLAVGEHLQAVLQPPQIQIGRAQLRDGRPA